MDGWMDGWMEGGREGREGRLYIVHANVKQKLQFKSSNVIKTKVHVHVRTHTWWIRVLVILLLGNLQQKTKQKQTKK